MCCLWNMAARLDATQRYRGCRTCCEKAARCAYLGEGGCVIHTQGSQLISKLSYHASSQIIIPQQHEYASTWDILVTSLQLQLIIWMALWMTPQMVSCLGMIYMLHLMNSTGVSFQIRRHVPTSVHFVFFRYTLVYRIQSESIRRGLDEEIQE